MRKLTFGLAVVALSAAPVSAGNTTAVERMKADLGFLASEQCEGRGVETEGIDKAAEYIIGQLKEAGLKPGGENGTWFQEFTITGRKRLGDDNAANLVGPQGQTITLRDGEDYRVSGLAGQGELNLPLVFVGHGITAEDKEKELNYDDYAGVDVEGKIAVILRQTPRPGEEAAPFVDPDNNPYSPLNYKIQNAVEHKAAGVIFVNDRDKAGDDDPLMTFDYARGGINAGFPVIHVRRAVLDRMLRGAGETTLTDIEDAIDRDLKPQSMELAGWKGAIKTDVDQNDLKARNVIALLEGSGPLQDETVVIGAHYDHLGRGETGSLARGDDRRLIHFGADDNGSGTTSVIELARRFGGMENREGRRMVFMLFSGEERGLLGSRHYADKPIYPLEDTAVMINLDMVGRLREGSLEIGGTGTAKGFDELIDTMNKKYQFAIKKSAGGLGPSDHAAFYPKKIPVFFFFTGLHEEYHRPTDLPDTINYEGMDKIADMVEELALKMTTGERPEYVEVSGGVRPGRGPTGPKMGFMPGNYDEGQQDGLPVDGITEGGPADKGGLKKGDIIISLGGKPVTNIGTYMSAMGAQKAGEPVKIVVKRGDEKVELTVTPE